MRTRTGAFLLLPLLVLLTGPVVFLSGCESESTAPKDDVPPPSLQTVARVGAYLGFYVNNAWSVFQQALTSANKDIDVQVFSSGQVSGSYTLDFRCGGADGAPCASDAPGTDYVRGFTATDQQVEVRRAGADTPLAVATFDAWADPYDNTAGAENGMVSGSGTLTAGSYMSSFTLESVFLSMSAYPPSGALTFASGDHSVRMDFNGTRYPELIVGEDTYLVDLDTGELIEPGD